MLTDLDGQGVSAFGASLDPSGERVVTLCMDAAKAEDSETAVEVARDRFGGIDFLVPSAGLYVSQPFGEMTDAQWR